MKKADLVKQPWSIDWSELKEIFISAIDTGQLKDLDYGANSNAMRAVRGGKWDGFTDEDIKRWIREGYRVERVRGIQPSIKLRERRRTVFSDEGDELHVDMALSGIDNFMSYQTKRQAIPGANIEAMGAFRANVPAMVIDMYATWLARAAYSLQETGVDPEISIRYSSARAFSRYSDAPITLVRVKKQGERTTFKNWSAMLSPAIYRGFGFVAKYYHAKAIGVEMSHGQGSAIGEAWDVTYNKQRKVIEVCNYHSATHFPAAEMDAKLKKAITSM